MKQLTTQKVIAWLALISGLSISAVAVYYSVVGLTAIFAAAVIPIIVMGTTLEISKLIATVWLKQNWDICPATIKAYLLAAIAVLMLITSMGIFGFLSKAHLDQGVPTGDVAAKVALIDEKIKTERDNVDANKKALQQMDTQVDQMLGRTTDSRGANRAVQIRKQQAKERKSLQADIATAQATIAKLNEERAPIASELRKVEAEVGPIKYIASFFYGATDETILEKAVTWVIITLISVFDPLAVILLLASQISFQNIRDRNAEFEDGTKEFFDRGKIIARAADDLAAMREERDRWIKIAADRVNPKPTETPIAPPVDKDVDPLALWNQMLEAAEGRKVSKPTTIATEPYVWTTTVYPAVDPTSLADEEDSGMGDELDIPVLENEETWAQRVIDESATAPVPVRTIDWTALPPEQEYISVDGQLMSVRAAKEIFPQTPKLEIPAGYVQNEEQGESSLWKSITTANQISEKEYQEKAAENTIDDFVNSVRTGKLPLYKVPYEIRDQVQERLQNDS